MQIIIIIIIITAIIISFDTSDCLPLLFSFVLRQQLRMCRSSLDTVHAGGAK
jgi:hypothetical protein